MEDLDEYLSPYYRRFNPEHMLNKHLKSAGFTGLVTKHRIEPVVYNDVEIFKDTYRSVIPFLQRISGSHHEEFMEEFVQIAQKITSNGQLNELNDENVNIIFPYKILTVYAKKQLSN